jgi:microsomal dipeptidase-like Zn-dependent dipeptidase
MPSVVAARRVLMCACIGQLLSTSPANAQRLQGFADMHTHPMSHLAFGGMIVYGAPDAKARMLPTQRYQAPGCIKEESPAGSVATALGNDNALHGGPGLFDNQCGDLIRMAIIDKLEERYERKFPAGGVPNVNDHPHEGYPRFEHWPHWSSVSHQQMWVDWIARAHSGGLRVMVALAVNNSLLAKATNATRYIDDRSSVDLQLSEIKALVERHAFMEVARTARELRDIVGRGKLAIVLGVETDDFGNLARRAAAKTPVTIRDVSRELTHLHAQGVRYLLPLHFSNTPLGGYAITRDLFALSSKEYTGEFASLRNSCGEGVRFVLDRPRMEAIETNLLRTRDLGRILDAQPVYRRPSPECGHANALGLTPLGRQSLDLMMDLGIMIDIDHMSRLAADAALALASARDYPLNSGHNGVSGAHCGTAPGEDPQRCNENKRTEAQYRKIRQLGGMVGLGHGGNTSGFVRSYRPILEMMGNRPVAIGTDVNGLEAQPAPDPAAPVTYDSTFPPYAFAQRKWDFNVDGFAHYGLFPDFVRSFTTASNPDVRMTAREMDAFMSSAEGFARMWEKTTIRAAKPRDGIATASTTFCRNPAATLDFEDFNGDGMADMLCRDRSRIWINYASNSRREIGGVLDGAADLSIATAWCTHAGASFFLGDFNGDGRTDQLCKDPGRIWLKFATLTGQFADPGSRVQDTDWCSQAGARLHIGDFDGDGRDDLLCRSNADVRIKHAGADGSFPRGDFSLATGFCTHPGAVFDLGDFNGDGRTDFFCKDPGRIWLNFATTDGRFLDRLSSATDTAFCSPSGSTLHLADVDGDGRTDLLCVSRDNVSLLSAKPAPDVFRGAVVWNVANWCRGRSVRAADVNGDKQSDIVCRGTGSLETRYSNRRGRFPA